MTKKLDGDSKSSVSKLLNSLVMKEFSEKQLLNASYNLSGFAMTLLKMQMEKKYGKTI